MIERSAEQRSFQWLNDPMNQWFNLFDDPMIQ